MTVLQQKIEALEKKMETMAEEEQKKDSKVSIGQWASSAGDNNVQWNVVKIEPTLNGMISRMDTNNTELVIGIVGLYKIIFRYTSRHNANSSSYWGRIYLNGSVVARSGHYNG
eukprot:28000_1